MAVRLVGHFSDIPTAIPAACDCGRLKRLLKVREDQADRHRRELYRQERDLAKLRKALRDAGIEAP